MTFLFLGCARGCRPIVWGCKARKCPNYRHFSLECESERVPSLTESHCKQEHIWHRCVVDTCRFDPKKQGQKQSHTLRFRHVNVSQNAKCDYFDMRKTAPYPTRKRSGHSIYHTVMRMPDWKIKDSFSVGMISTRSSVRIISEKSNSSSLPAVSSRPIISSAR